MPIGETIGTNASGGMTAPLPLVISIEGNIGVGKSTQIHRLQELFRDNERVVVLPEPVDEWVDKGFLGGMYDGSISKGEFQHMALMSLAGDLLKALARKPTPAVVITERSPFGNNHVFARANLTGESLALYEHTWVRVVGGLPSQLRVKYAYLDADVDVIVERMAARGRAAESQVPRDYLEKLDRLHKEWLGSIEVLIHCPERHAYVDARNDENQVWRDLCRQLKTWFEEAGEAFKKERELKAASEHDRMLTGMIMGVQQGVQALEHQTAPVAR